MSETLHIQSCPICASTLSAIYDTIEGKLTLRPENLPPLAKDCLAVVSLYKRLKGLGAPWERSHGPRGIVYAQSLLEAVGAYGGQLERALGLLEWLKEKGKDFDLDSAPTFYNEYQEHIKALANVTRSRCLVCGISFSGQGPRCQDHEWVSDDELRKWNR